MIRVIGQWLLWNIYSWFRCSSLSFMNCCFSLSHTHLPLLLLCSISCRNSFKMILNLKAILLLVLTQIYLICLLISSLSLEIGSYFTWEKMLIKFPLLQSWALLWQINFTLFLPFSWFTGALSSLSSRYIMRVRNRRSRSLLIRPLSQITLELLRYCLIGTLDLDSLIFVGASATIVREIVQYRQWFGIELMLQHPLAFGILVIKYLGLLLLQSFVDLFNIESAHRLWWSYLLLSRVCKGGASAAWFDMISGNEYLAITREFRLLYFPDWLISLSVVK